MLLGTLGASLLGNMLAKERKVINRAVEGIIRAGYGSNRSSIKKRRIFNAASSLTNFELQKYYQNEPLFNGVYSRDNLPNKIKSGVYVINLDGYSCIETHWIALYALNNNITYFNSFGSKNIPKEIKKFIGKKNKHLYKYTSIWFNNVRIFCIAFIDFMLTGRRWTEFKNSLKSQI